jgi:hypothetical protein
MPAGRIRWILTEFATARRFFWSGKDAEGQSGEVEPPTYRLAVRGPVFRGPVVRVL